jgi:hypothetical protein
MKGRNDAGDFHDYCDCFLFGAAATTTANIAPEWKITGLLSGGVLLS